MQGSLIHGEVTTTKGKNKIRRINSFIPAEINKALGLISGVSALFQTTLNKSLILTAYMLYSWTPTENFYRNQWLLNVTLYAMPNIEDVKEVLKYDVLNCSQTDYCVTFKSLYNFLKSGKIYLPQ